MRVIGSGLTLFGCLFGLMLSNMAVAAGDEIEIVKAEGKVVLSDASGKKEKSVGTNSVLPPKNVLATGPDGRAVVRMGNKGFIVLEKNSKVEIGENRDHAGFLRQLTGMIYYALNKLKGDQQDVQVRTRTATIGVRGTRFLIADTEGRNEIGMRKGLVSVASLEGEFEIHRKSELDEFEAYKQQAADAIAKEKKAFEEYKASTEREFIEYKREFSLGANRMASFDGNRVVDRPLSAESVRDMESIESYADDWLKQVQD
ncbi:MAG: FecR domain-containing protein [Nitrosomonadales bacterium]|nr:FecR domain-containing protein [Nitrosomonadales bacterium]